MMFPFSRTMYVRPKGIASATLSARQSLPPFFWSG